MGHNSPPDVFGFEIDTLPFIGHGDRLSVEEFVRICPDLDKATAAEIAHLFAHIKEQYDLIESQRKELSKFVELIKCVKLPAAFDREEIKTFTLQNGTRVTKSDRTFASIIGPVDEAYAWLRGEGKNEDLIKETVNSSALSSYAKAVLDNVVKDPETGMMMAKDEDLPIDLPTTLFKVEIRPTTSVVRGKK